MKRKIIREKKHRLPDEMYVGVKSIAFTICIKNNKKLFISEHMLTIFEKVLVNSLNEHNCSGYVYLFMPDHLHMIIKGENKKSNIKQAVELFKQKTGFWLSNNLPNIKWQKDYYDHIIRNEEDIQNQIRYILNNPVRANLVKKWKDYNFKGSTIFNLKDWE